MQDDAEDLGRPRDGQQRRVVERLRAARGEPVDFEELLAIGVEHPAVVCYELELSGVPIDQRREGHRLLFSLPLGAAMPTAEAQPRRIEPRRPVESPRRVQRQPRASEGIARARRRLARTIARARRASGSTKGARLALSCAAAALIALATVLLASSPTERPGAGEGARAGASRTHAQAPFPASGNRAREPTPATPGGARTQTVPTIPGRLQARTPPVAISPATAVALESEGHRLLAAGRYSAAIDRLLGAIRASGSSLARCTEPTTHSCLTFAYALYDLGRALRLGGDPGSAIPVLEQRLRIDNQRPVVRQELDLARAAGA